MKHKCTGLIKGAGKSMRLFLVALFTIISIQLYAQTKTVNGKVVDQAGEPVIGANVIEKGTKNGSMTDFDGVFKIDVNDNAILQISYIGYKTADVKVAGKSKLNIELEEDSEALDEVVVVGYGVQKKSDVTGSMISVGAKELEKRPVANAFEAMQGKAAGVDITSNERPGELGSIRIRGNRSLNASNAPLYVVDGIPMNSGGIENLNPRDIESIDILKDASATAIYGYRGANGVVLVTTKRGKEGAFELNYSGTFTFEKTDDLSPAMTASEYITWRRWACHNSSPNSNTPGDQPTKEQDMDMFSGDPIALANVMRGWASGTWDASKVVDTDWTDFVTQTGLTHEHTISASGGTDKMKSFLSFGYLNNEGTQIGQSYERYTAKITTDISPKKWINLAASMNVAWSVQDYGFSRTGQSSNTGPTDVYGAAKKIFRYAEPYDENGDVIMYPGGESTVYTIMDEWNKSNDERQNLRALGSFSALINFEHIYKPLKGLSFKSTFGPDYRYNRQGIYIDSSSAARLGGTSYAKWAYSRNFSWTLDNIISYNKKINDHSFDLTLVQTASKSDSESGSMSAVNIPKASFKWNNMGSVDITSTSSKASMGTGFVQQQMESYMARLNYSYLDKYLLTASVRQDGASVLAEGHNKDIFFSAALGWRLDQEQIFSDISWLNQLKLRLGWGETGNASVNPYDTKGNIQSFYVPFGSSGNVLAYATNEPYYTSKQVLMANPLLGWERTAQTNIGIDFSVLDGRIGGTIDAYTSKTTDLLLKLSVPTLTGYSQVWGNIGETNNKGIDVTLNIIPVQTKDFEWSTTLNTAYQKDKIVSLMNGKQDMVADGFFIDAAIQSFYGYKSDGLWKESDAEEMAKFNANGHKFEAGTVKPVDQDGNYFINSEDRVVLGSKTPRWTFGWGNTFSWKGIELSIDLYGRFKYMINDGGEGQMGMYNQRKIDYWTPSNQNAEYQKPFYNASGGDSYSSLLGFREASFLKIRNISLGYYLPKIFCKNLGINNLKVYAQCKNPGTIYSSVDHLDLDLGTSYFNRGVTFGVQIGF